MSFTVYLNTKNDEEFYETIKSSFKSNGMLFTEKLLEKNSYNINLLDFNIFNNVHKSLEKKLNFLNGKSTKLDSLNFYSKILKSMWEVTLMYSWLHSTELTKNYSPHQETFRTENIKLMLEEMKQIIEKCLVVFKVKEVFYDEDINTDYIIEVVLNNETFTYY